MCEVPQRHLKVPGVGEWGSVVVESNFSVQLRPQAEQKWENGKIYFQDFLISQVNINWFFSVKHQFSSLVFHPLFDCKITYYLVQGLIAKLS